MRPVSLLSIATVMAALSLTPTHATLWATPQARQITRTADGFVLAVPAGWRENTEIGGAAGISPIDGSDAYLSVSVRREPARAPVSDVMTRIVAKMRSNTDPALISSRFGTYLKRRAVFAELQDDTARYRVVIVPRDAGETSQDYFLITAWAAKDIYTKMQPAFDRIVTGFDITAVAPPPPAKEAAAPARQGLRPITDEDTRLAWFEARLRPGPCPEVAPASPGDKNQQKLVDAAQAYAKGLTFASQGAWAEAQTAFRDAEKKNELLDTYVMASAWAYLKVHKPADAMKRYEERYKKNPANATALVGMIAAFEESQNYREAVKLWKRYATLGAAAEGRAEVTAMVLGAQELFAARYEIAENPAGGAANLASAADELAWGESYARELASSGVPLVTDPEVVSYVEALCQNLVDHSKLFPSNYQLFVLDSATVNAMTVPGYIFVYRGILDASESEAALAGVLAHEIGHSVAHHTAKKVTKNYQDQKQLEALQKSSGKLSQFLAKMLAGGNPLGALSFSREAEAQADRLAVHIAFDSGFAPTGINQLFQKFEQMSPSSRNSWDLMARTHPFSIDRINSVKEYAALLPERQTKTTSPAFERMKKRLSALPPPSDATGMMKAPTQSTTPGATQRTGAAATMKTVPFTMSPAPFSGEIPAGWTFTKKSGTYAVISAPAGTPYFEMTMTLETPAKASHAGRSIDDMVEVIRAANVKTPGIQFAEVERRRSAGGIEMRFLNAMWPGKTTAGAQTTIQAMWVFADFPDYYAIGYYGAPKDFFTKLGAGFDIMMDSLTYGATDAPASAPAPAPKSTPSAPAGRQPFSIEVPPYSGEMPAGWTLHDGKDPGVIVIEAPQGTDAYEVTVKLTFFNKSGNSLDGLAQTLAGALQKLPSAEVTASPNRTTQEGRPLRAMSASYQAQNLAKKVVPFTQLVAVVEYPSHFVVLSYWGPDSLIERYLPAYQMVGTTLKPRK